MKSLLFIPLISSLCAAIAVHSNDKHLTHSLVTRADGDDNKGQKATNPDNEPDDEDPVTKEKIRKSLVLEIGAPQEATNRWFDWDESCTDEKDRQKITAAFQDTIGLAGQGSQFLTDLQNGLPKKPPGSSANKGNIAYIVKEDPAFTQMFYAQDNRIQYVKDTYDLLVSKMKSFDGRNGDGANGVRFICDRQGKVKTAGGDSYCG